MDFNELKKAKTTDIESCDRCLVCWSNGHSFRCMLSGSEYLPFTKGGSIIEVPDWCPLRDHPVILNLSRYLKVGHEMEG